MVKKTIIHKVINLIYAAYRHRCVTLGQVADFVKKREKDVSHSLVRLALDALVRDGRARKVKLYKFYVLYCIEKEPNLDEVVDGKKIEECISKYMPSFTLMQVAECVLGHRPAGSPSVVYSSILYVLMRMVKEGKIYSFTLLRGTRSRLKAVVRR